LPRSSHRAPGRVLPILWAMLCGPGVHSAPIKVHQLEGGLSIRMPEAASISEESSAGDAVVYRLRNLTGKRFLLIYLGNRPSFLRAPRGASASRTSISGLAAAGIRWSDSQGRQFGLVRIRLPAQRWPAFVQFSYGPLSRDEADIAETVIGSVRTGPQDGGEQLE